jgi:hypothetical protein
VTTIERSQTIHQDHLFISYASEDLVLADWLALKLASAGYRVWYDRLKLLGGESYPHDITEAIRNQTFRVIALLSRNSIDKPNPVKERTLALNIAKERKIDFLIPVNVDGLKPTELDFMTSDLVFIHFKDNWFAGLSALLKKLENIGAPRDESKGRQAVSVWLSAEERPKEWTEVLWSNLLPVLEFPKVIRRYTVVPEVDIGSVAPDWPVYWESESSLWAFGAPASASSDWLEEESQFDFRVPRPATYIPMKNILSGLLRRRLEQLCLGKGLALFEEKGRLHFPNNMFPNNRLQFTRYDGRKISIRVVGLRTFRTTSQGSSVVETTRYHLSPDFRFFFDLLGSPVFRLRIGIHWTDTNGHPLDDRKAFRRRKALCKDWWNYEWLSRMMAITQWLGDGHEEITLLKTDSGNFRLSLKPLTFSSNFGIDEGKPTELEEVEGEMAILEDADEGEDEDAEKV